MRRILLAAVMFGAASGAQAADMPDFFAASFTDGLTTPRANWQGYYVGGQVGYGVRYEFHGLDQAVINSDMQSTFAAGCRSANLAAAGARRTTSWQGFGAFAGYNSQWEDVVVGLEANYIHGEFRADSRLDGHVTIQSADLSVYIDDPYRMRRRSGCRISASLRVRAGYIVGCVPALCVRRHCARQADIARSRNGPRSIRPQHLGHVPFPVLSAEPTDQDASSSMATPPASASTSCWWAGCLLRAE